MSRLAPAPASRSLLLRWVQLVLGFAGWGLSAALMLRAGLGVGPWDAFHVGLHNVTGMRVGTASIVTGAAILAGTMCVGVRPGPGTLANMVAIGVFMDLFLQLVPAAASVTAGVLYFGLALVLAGWFTGVYVAAELGAGPRDGLVLRLAERTGWSVRRVRALVEVAVLGAGWALGGPLGWGTLIYAVGIGPAMQWGLRRWNVLPRREVPVGRPPLRRAA